MVVSVQTCLFSDLLYLNLHVYNKILPVNVVLYSFSLNRSVIVHAWPVAAQRLILCMGETSILPEICVPLSLWGGIHPAPVTANPPLEEIYPQGGPHLFPSCLPPHVGKIMSLPLPEVSLNS